MSNDNRTPYKARLNAKGSASGRLGERDCKQQENVPPLSGTAFPGPFLAFPLFQAAALRGLL